MARPLWALAGLALLGIAGGAGILIASSGGEEEASVQQVTTGTPGAGASAQPAATATPAESAAPTSSPDDCDRVDVPGEKLWRWANVTVLLPDEPDYQIHPEVFSAQDGAPGDRQGFNVMKIDPSDSRMVSFIAIDAETGAVLSEDVLPQDQASMQQAKSTVKVCPFDAATAPWPYNGDPPSNAERLGWFGMSVIRPHPSTGMFVQISVGASGRRGTATPKECEVAGDSLQVSTSRSVAFVWLDVNTGAICRDLSYVQSDDTSAFERYLSEVKRCGKDIVC